MFGLAKRNSPSLPLTSRPIAFTWLLSALFLVVLPHVTRMPLWVTLSFACLSAYRLLHDRAGWQLPSRWVGALLAMLTIGGIAASFTVSASRRAAIALLR